MRYLITMLVLSGCADYSKLSAGKPDIQGAADGGVGSDAAEPAGDLAGAVVADLSGADLKGADLASSPAVDGSTAVVADMSKPVVADMAAPCIDSLANIGTANFAIRFTITTTAQVSSDVAYQRSDCNVPTSDFWSISMNAIGKLEMYAENGDPYPKYASDGASLDTTIAVNDGAPHDVVFMRIAGTMSTTTDGVASGSVTMPAHFRTLPALGIASGDPCGTTPMPGAITNFCLQTF